MTSPLSWIVGAYSASPTRWGWNVDEELEYLDGLLALPTVRGFEVPFSDDLHKYDETWFLRWLPKHLDVVITVIPGTTARVKDNPNFGLASNDKEGRLGALKLAEQVRQSVKRVNDSSQRNAVVAVQFHSAPGPRLGSGAALRESLAVLTQQNWDEAAITIEHCDALLQEQEPQKGYLRLADELDAIDYAITQGHTRLGVTINWGRSAIETRTAEGPLSHIQTSRSRNRLLGVMFSGAASVDTRFGGAWTDVHVPHAPFGPAVSGRELLEPHSAMTSTEMSRCLQAANLGEDSAAYIGLKIAPLKDATIRERILTVQRSLEVLNNAASYRT